jgi:hypothetical protein
MSTTHRNVFLQKKAFSLVVVSPFLGSAFVKNAPFAPFIIMKKKRYGGFPYPISL